METPIEKYNYKLSIVIPAYNEEFRITPTLRSTINFLLNNGISSELIVVNDGSTDKTQTVVEEISSERIKIKHIKLKQNQGKGYAVKTGIENSEGEYILYMDADGSTPIIELNRFLDEISNYDMVIGSRYSNSTIVKRQPFHRIIIGKIGRFILSSVITDITDTQCGFKLLKNKAAMNLFSLSKINRFGFDAEILYLAKRNNYRIKELPVEWSHIDNSGLNPITDPLVTLWELAIIKINVALGKYNKK